LVGIAAIERETRSHARPLLVIVSGPPATGKTTLAERLAPELGLFLLAKDDIKERLGDRLPAKSLSDSQRLGDATFHLLFHLANHAIRSGVSLLIESPFYRGFHEAELAPMVGRSRAVLIHCYSPQDVAARRFRARAERGERHPVHFDKEQPFALLGNPEEDWDQRARPLDLDIPTLVLDTTEGYVDDIAPGLEFIRSSVSA